MNIKKCKIDAVEKEVIKFLEKAQKSTKLSEESKGKVLADMLVISSSLKSLVQRALTISYKSNDEEEIFCELFQALSKKHNIVAVFKVSGNLTVDALNKVKEMKKFVDRAIIVISNNFSEDNTDVEVNIGYLVKSRIYEPSYVIEQIFENAN